MATEIKISRPIDRGSVNPPRFLTVEELAEMLRVEVRTIYSWVSKRSVPFRKAGAQCSCSMKFSSGPNSRA